jgi:hypothetical protein
MTSTATPTLTATCHCGAVRVDVPHPPLRVNDCNCSICRRYGVLWAYYPAASVRVHAAVGALDGYVWGDKMLRFLRCANCGCVTHWEPLGPVECTEMGVNARNFGAGTLDGVAVVKRDGASAHVTA